jgi:Ca2+-binding EF-hand superfamily protein
VIEEKNPAAFARHGIAPPDLARITAEQCFLEADLNHDGLLSFEEFKSWYSLPSGNDVTELVAANPPPPPPAHAPPARGAAGGSLPTLARMRTVTGLGGLDPDEVIGVFESAAAADADTADGELDRGAFDACFRIIAKATGQPAVPEEVLAALFALFDTDGNGVVDFAELGSGLSVLCGGNRDSKVQAAFDLYDANGDGFIALDEMTSYLGSVFKPVRKRRNNPQRLACAFQ